MSDIIAIASKYFLPVAGKCGIYVFREVLTSGVPVEIDFRQVNLNGGEFWPYGVYMDNTQGTERLDLYLDQVFLTISANIGAEKERMYPGVEDQSVTITGAGLVTIVFCNFPVPKAKQLPGPTPPPPPVPNPLWPYTTLLMHFDGTNGATTTVDSGPLAKSLILQNAAVLTDSWKKFGPTSLQVVSGSQVVYTVNNTGLQFDTEIWTIELWINRVDLATRSILDWRQSSSDSAPCLYLSAGDIIFYSSLGARITGACPIGEHFISVCYDGANTRMHIDGVLAGTWAGSRPWYARPNCLFGFSDMIGLPGPGNIDEVRVLKGVALYGASAYTPPTEPFPGEFLP